MNKKIFLQLIFIGVLLGFRQTMAWTQDKFIIYSFWDPCISGNTDYNARDAIAQDVRSFWLAKNAYFNLLTGTGNDGVHVFPDGYQDPLNTPNIDYALYIASLAGLNYLVNYSCQPGVCTFKNIPFSQRRVDNEVNHWRNALTLGRRLALYGYLIADEPIDQTNAQPPLFPHEIEPTKQWVQGFKTGDVDKLAYVNMIAEHYWSESHGCGVVFDYNAYVDNVINDNNSTRRPDIVAMDYYPIRGPGCVPDPVSVRAHYFWSLNLLKDKAITTGRPLWVICNVAEQLSTTPPDWAYPPTTEANIRFQPFTALAYGAKGIGYFCFETPEPRTVPDAGFPDIQHCIIRNCDADPRPTCDGGRTKYEVVREINRYITNIVGPMIMTSSLVGVYHRSNYPPNQIGIPPEQNLSIRASNDPLLYLLGNDRVMAGVFRDKFVSTTFYILVVNKDIDNLQTTEVQLNGNRMSTTTMASTVIGYDGNTNFTPPPGSITYSGGKTVFQVLLAAGEGRLIKVTNVLSGPTLTKFRPQGQISVAKDADGRLFCFARGTNDSVYYQYQNENNLDYWNPKWTSLKNGLVKGAIAVGKNSDGALYVFSKNSNNNLIFQSQTTPSRIWGGNWISLSGSISGNDQIVAASYDKYQDKQIVLARSSNKLFFWAQTFPLGTFDGNMVPNSPSIGEKIAAGFNPGDGSLDVFVTNTSKQLLRVRFYRYGNNWIWSSFSNLGGPIEGEIAVGRNQLNYLEVFVVGTDHTVYHSYQWPAGSTTWSNWEQLATTQAYDGLITVAPNQDGRLELFMKNSNGFLQHICQVAPNSGWGTLADFENGSITVGTSHICAENYWTTAASKSKLAVFAACAGNSNIFYVSQVDVNSGWNPFLPFTNN